MKGGAVVGASASPGRIIAPERPPAEEGVTGDRRATDTPEEARAIGDQIGVDWDRFDLEQFRAGMDVEYEHGSHDPQPT